MSRLRGAKEEGWDQGKEEGIKKGIKEGIEKGQKVEKRNVAINLLKKNADIEIIKIATGLTVKEIDEIKKEI